ncbi:MAG: SCP2 sterol-binding domain-containing protein [Lachnospiraceae bacterium]|nr:SCP2 sterol-binding domain-containing protein [Lachnospiraceae bacterium]
MKVNIYYGGRGILDDPTLYVLKKMEQVLEELRVTVERYNIYERKNEIALLPQTFKDCDAVILATTVEWLGIGGYMQQFLDACWMYADKENLSGIYMLPVVMSTTYGEREGVLTLENAWEILGGQLCSGICGYVDDLLSFEMNKEYTLIIEKKAENLYRTISQKIKCLPTSNQAVKQSVLRTQSLDLTPQESEQLSKYVSNDTYVETQKKDIEELASLFRDRMEKNVSDEESSYVRELMNHFNGQPDFSASYFLKLKGLDKGLVIRIDGDELNCSYGIDENVDVYGRLTEDTMDDIVAGRMTFQRAFMTGDMTAKGNFKTLRMLDTVFQFA